MAPSDTPQGTSLETRAIDSRTAILDAATREFVEKGFHGARIEHIASRSGFNKGLIYRYFGDRKQLVRAVLERELTKRVEVLEGIPDGLADALLTWFRETAGQDAQDYIGLLHQEALADDGSEPTAAAARGKYYDAQAEVLAQWQAAGRLDGDFDPRFLLLGLLSLVAYPASFPQVARLITGLNPEDEAFRESWAGVLTFFAAAIERSDGDSDPA